MTKRLGFFTRILDDAEPAARYRLAREQIVHAERLGFDTAWIAQHHFNRDEGGQPSPFVFLANVAAVTSRIRLGTGIVTLPLDEPVRVAEDAAVLDALSGGRLELGLGSGGTASSFAAFDLDSAERGAIFGRKVETLRRALRGEALGGGNRLYPPAGDLDGRVWQATFSAPGGARAGEAGDGLLLSRTQPRPEGQPDLPLADLQLPIVEAYHAALPAGAAPRILASRSVFVADRRDDARRLAEAGLRRVATHFAAQGHVLLGDSLDDLLRTFDSHVGTPDEVAESLSRDGTLEHATEVSVQVHSIDPPHPFILRSIEIFATEVAPALGWHEPSRPALARAV